MVINLESVLLDPNSTRTIEFWTFIQEVQLLAPMPNSLEASPISSFTLSGVVPCLRQQSTLAIPYAVLFRLQACSPPDELYAVGHYHPGKQRNLSNGSSVKDDMRSKYLVCIPSARQSAITNDMQVRTSAYADSTPYHLTSSSVL
ncbi:hypothetical protein TNCV_221571 [Trichonephila clavipes]|nr:hypothetical protein TNCV_221571 [Trichonephila clavipes]